MRMAVHHPKQTTRIDANSILVKPLLGSIQLADLRCVTSARTTFVHKLGYPVMRRTVGVQFR